MLKRNESLMAIFLGFLMFMLATVIPVALVEAETNIKYGLWETTIETEMTGIPMKQPAVTHTQCLTKENLVPDSSPPNSECKMVDKKIVGNTATWRMECKGDQGPADMTGKITYTGDTYEGTIKINTQGITMIQTLNGKRIGECNQ